MELSIIILTTTVLSTFATTSTDLCADVYVDANGQPYTDSAGRTLPRYCKWTGPNPPKLAADVCCIIDEDGAACGLPDANGRCTWGVRRYCQYGEVGASGGVVCMQPFPDACALGYCVQAPELPPPTEPLVACCLASCHLITNHEEIVGCTGSYVACGWGQSNEDGTVTCYGPGSPD
jgi:hypothetical protein